MKVRYIILLALVGCLYGISCFRAESTNTARDSLIKDTQDSVGTAIPRFEQKRANKTNEIYRTGDMCLYGPHDFSWLSKRP
jgi:hypothetical protein